MFGATLRPPCWVHPRVPPAGPCPGGASSGGAGDSVGLDVPGPRARPRALWGGDGGQSLLGCPGIGSEELEASGGLWGCRVWGVPSCLVGGAGGQRLGAPQNFPHCQHRVPAATSR